MPPRVFNATEKCAHCNEGLAIHAGEVYVRFIALSSLFERAQGRVSGEKSGEKSDVFFHHLHGLVRVQRDWKVQ